MKNFEEIDHLVDSIISLKLPKNDFILFMNYHQKMETDIFFKTFGGGYILEASVPNAKNAERKVDCFVYRGITFYIVETGWYDQEPHTHNWAETKSFFGDSGAYVLTRWCNNCGKTETFHGTDKRWVSTGYLKDCNRL